MLLNVRETIDNVLSHKENLQRELVENSKKLENLHLKLMVYEDVLNQLDKKHDFIEKIDVSLLENKNKITTEINDVKNEIQKIKDNISFIDIFLEKTDIFHSEAVMFLNYTEILLDIKLKYTLFHHENNKCFFLIINYYNPAKDELLLFYPQPPGLSIDIMSNIIYKNYNIKSILRENFYRTMRRIYHRHDMSMQIYDVNELPERIENLKKAKRDALKINIDNNINDEANSNNNIDNNTNIINPKDIVL